MKKFYTGTNDIVFKAIFCNEKNKDLLKELLIESNIEVDEIISVSSFELPKNNFYEKKKLVDLIVKTKGKIIDVEINTTNYKGLHERNFCYIADKYIKSVNIDNYI